MRTRTRHTLSDLALALAVLVALVAAAVAVFRTVPELACAHFSPVRDKALPSDDWYLDFGPHTAGMGYWLLYLGIGTSVDHAKRADVLLLGNSRTLFAFPKESLEAFHRETGLICYNLGFGYGETYRFPLAVMERWGMRPRLVIVNADRFFDSAPSGLAMQVMHRGWTGYLERMVNERAGTVYGFLTGWLPDFLARIPLDCNKEEATSRILRSVSTGAWLPEGYGDRTSPVAPDQGLDHITEQQLENARNFQSRIQALGARLVMTHVPSSEQYGTRQRAQELARLLGVPFAAPLPQGLSTLDGSHLDRKSALRFSNALFQELKQSPILKSTLQPRPDGEF